MLVVYCLWYYKRRQAIVEHPYGTIKRQWGFNYIITKKSIKRAGADIGLMMIAYNLRRIMNIVGMKQLTDHLKEAISYFVWLFYGKYQSIERIKLFRNAF
jgi:hypothetical protein